VNLTDFSLRNPYTVVALALLMTALGLFAFLRTPTDLFPDTVPPQVIVVTVQPGAAAADIADKITQVIEKELNTTSGLRRIVSTSRDGVSSINAEFHYDKSIGEAVIDVQNALSRIRPDLPADILEPRIYRITDATRPLLTLALSPRPGSTKTLTEIRLLARNQIEDDLLTLPGIADVDVFGAHQPVVEVRLRRDALATHHVSLEDVVTILARQNVSAPVGTIYSGGDEVLVRTTAEFASLQEIRELPVSRTHEGTIRVDNLGSVRLAQKDPRSLYHGNGKAAIAVNVLRPHHGPTVAAIKTVKDHLPLLEARFPDIVFEITNDQEPVIDANVNGMRQSLIQAVLFTVLVIFVFLADFRAAIVVSVSIPLAFLTSLVVLWFSPYTLNMVTLSGLIISVGMVVDASIVVLENIYRHRRELKEPDPRRAAREGASEVALAITAGMFTTVIVLIPVMFAGGYTQQTMRPLNLMISSTLVASLLVALTVIPLIAAWILRRKREEPNPVERVLGLADRGVRGLTALYVAILGGALRRRTLTVAIAAAFFVITMKVVPPLIGGELMPPMDTGIALINFDAPSNAAPSAVEDTLSAIEAMVFEEEGVEMISSVVGSEPGEISFGGGGTTAQSGTVTVTLIDRTRRERSIWEIEDTWRDRLRTMPGVRTYRVSEYGATPLSTTRAPLDVIVSGPDPVILSRLADRVLDALRGLPGLVDTRRSWYADKVEEDVRFVPTWTRDYGTSPAEATRELAVAVNGVSATTMRLRHFLDIPIRVRYAERDIDAPVRLGNVYVTTRFGPVPLRAMADVERHRTPPFVTRERHRTTIDITGVNRTMTIGQVGAAAARRLKRIETPEGYSIAVSGTPADMKTGKEEMGRALLIGIVLLYFLLLAMFKSFGHPITIMAAIPLAVAGAMWGLLLFDKPMCKPATMGLILLGGTVVNNSILLLEFIVAARRRGVEKREAILDAVRLRVRPILMTTVSTIVGLLPLILERAVGLERMSPLGVVAACGLLVGTFLTMIVIPVVYSSLDSVAVTLGGFRRFLFGVRPAPPA